jgi:hypothetical protein
MHSYRHVRLMPMRRVPRPVLLGEVLPVDLGFVGGDKDSECSYHTASVRCVESQAI